MINALFLLSSVTPALAFLQSVAEEIPAVMLFGVPVPLLVLLLVQLLKATGVLRTPDHARLADIVIGALCAVALVFVAQIPNETVSVISIFVTGFYNIAMASLVYIKIAKP